MRRLAAIAAFALFVSVPVWAQHGGGHGGGHAGSGGHAGFGTGHSNGGGHGFGGMHSGAGVSRGFSHSASPRSFSGRGLSSRSFRHDGFRRDRDRFRFFGFNNNCFGYPCRGGYYYPWAYGAFDPWWWWDSGSSYDDDYNRDVAAAAEMNRENLEEQRMLRQEEADGDQDSYARTPRAPLAYRPGTQSKDDPPASAIVSNTVLVFRDQHKQEVSNYAIVGQTLWNFAPGHTQKIPLSSLDLPATTKANDDLGVSFRVPGSGEGQ